MKVLVGFANALAKCIHTLDNELRRNVVLWQAFVPEPSENHFTNVCRHRTRCRVRPDIDVVADTVFRMGSGVSFPGSRDVKFSAPLQAGVIERQPGCIRPQAIEFLADPQQSRHSGYREVVVLGVTACNLTDGRLGLSRISRCR